MAGKTHETTEQETASAAPQIQVTPEELKPMNIYQRLNLVRKVVDYLQKDATISGSGTYKAITHDMVTSAVRDHLVTAGVMVVPEEVSSEMKETGAVTAKGVPMMRFEAKYHINFVSIDDPKDKVTVTLTAHANDVGDKAPGKAVSYATKTAMLKLFSIETGESDESREDMKAPADKVDMFAMIRLGRHIERNWNTIQAIKNGILNNQMDIAAEAWFELDNDEKRQIWVAPTKGGPFTTKERDIIMSKEFREAHFGPQVPKEEAEQMPGEDNG